MQISLKAQYMKDIFLQAAGKGLTHDEKVYN